MIKNKLLIMIIMLLFTGCGMRVNIMGIDVQSLKQRQYGKVLSGALVSVAVHEAAHYFVATAKGRDIEFHGTNLEYYGQDDLIDRSGFLAQTMTGLLLNYIPATKDSDFTFGWNTITTLQLYSYPLRHENDGDFSDIGTNEWGLFTALSSFNTYSTIDNMNKSYLKRQKGNLKPQN